MNMSSVIFYISFFFLSLTGCMTLGKFLNLSICHLSHLQNGKNIR